LHQPTPATAGSFDFDQQSRTSSAGCCLAAPTSICCRDEGGGHGLLRGAVEVLGVPAYLGRVGATPIFSRAVAIRGLIEG